MPKVRRENFPPALLHHLLDRLQQRGISVSQLGLLADWLSQQPEVPAGKWFKRFADMIVCGEGELVKTRRFSCQDNFPMVRKSHSEEGVGRPCTPVQEDE
jgi:hypothetical protein